MDALYIVSRESVVEAMRILKSGVEADVLLVGRGVLVPVTENMFGKRKIYVMREELKSMGIPDKKGDNLEIVSAEEMIDIIAERRIYNFS